MVLPYPVIRVSEKIQVSPGRLSQWPKQFRDEWVNKLFPIEKEPKLPREEEIQNG